MKSIAFRVEYTQEYLCINRIPRYYGLAYRRFEVMTCVFFIIPFNLIVRWLRDAYFFVIFAPSYREKIERIAYDKGFEAGCKSERARSDYFYKRPVESMERL